MKATPGTIYQCDHCKRKSVSAGGMASHERACRKNPNNQHACFKYCAYLNREIDQSNGTTLFNCGNDKCSLYELDLYSYKLERTPSVNASRIARMVRMPLTCEHYRPDVGKVDDTFFERDQE